jgi:hypothetical protein
MNVLSITHDVSVWNQMWIKEWTQTPKIYNCFSIFLHFLLIQSLFQKNIIPFDVNIDKNLYNLTNLDTQLEWFNSIPPNYSFTYFTRLYFLFNVIYLPYRTVTASCSTSMCEETLYKIDIDYFFHYLQLILIWSLSLKMKWLLRLCFYFHTYISSKLLYPVNQTPTN